MQKNMHFMLRWSKTLVWKQDYDIKLWRQRQRTSNTNDHHTIPSPRGGLWRA